MVRQKRFIALILAISMLLSNIPVFALDTGGETPMRQSEMSSEAQRGVADIETFSKRKNFSPDEKKFTHLEYTGKTENGIKNSNVFQVNREPAHTANTTVVYQNIEAARKGALDYNKEASDYYQLLTGENNDWKLTVVKNAEAAQPYLDAGFMDSGYNPNGPEWKTVQLPKSWTRDGFDYSIYTNVKMPWQEGEEGVSVPYAPENYNPVGLYRKTFTVKDGLKTDGRRVYISFQGVESAYYLYVNGKEVGYSEDSYRLCPSRKNRHEKALKNGMKRKIALLLTNYAAKRFENCFA